MTEGVGLFCPLTLDFIYEGLQAFPKNGEEVYAENFRMTLGGGSIVAAMRLHQAGVEVSMGSFWNDGAQSKAALSLAESFGFQKTLVNFYKGEKEPVIASTVFTDAKERNIVSFDAHCGEEALTDSEIYGFLSGKRLCVATKRPSVLKALHEEGTKLFYDVHWAENLSMQGEAEILRYADFFTPNAKEAMTLTKTNTPKAAIEILQNYTACPIVKLGKDGAMAYVNGNLQCFAPPKVKPKDTTGAGDNFLAGLLFSIYHNLPLPRALEIANAAGAISTEAVGCFGKDYNLLDFLTETERELLK